MSSFKRCLGVAGLVGTVALATGSATIGCGGEGTGAVDLPDGGMPSVVPLIPLDPDPLDGGIGDGGLDAGTTDGGAKKSGGQRRPSTPPIPTTPAQAQNAIEEGLRNAAPKAGRLTADTLDCLADVVAGNKLKPCNRLFDKNRRR